MNLTTMQTEQETSSISQPTPQMLIHFEVGPLQLGIEVRRVREVIRAVSLSAPLPEAGPVVGMITLRGEAVTVVDLAKLLGIANNNDDRGGRIVAVKYDDSTICLRIDRICGLFDVDSSQLQTPPSMIGDVVAHWLDYVAKTANDELIGVLNVDRVLSQVSLQQKEAKPICV